MSVSLTQRQQQLVHFVLGYQRAHNQSPCLREIGAALGIGGKGAVHRLLITAEERGAIRRLPFRARAIEVTAMPRPASVTPDGEPLFFVPIGGRP